MNCHKGNRMEIFMFHYLNGELALIEPGTCVIDCCGVGYKLTVSLLTT